MDPSELPRTCDNTKCKGRSEGQGPVLETGLARARHLGVVTRLRIEGPIAVGAVAAEVLAWADARATAEEQRQAAEVERLNESFGERGWPPGMRTRLKARHHREQRQVRLEAINRFLEEFGRPRILDTPLSETAILGASVGAALTGLRPVAEMQFADFIANGFNGSHVFA